MAKPNGRAAMAREWLAAQDKSKLVLERVPPGRPAAPPRLASCRSSRWASTSSPASRLKTKGEGKGGVRKRAQYALPTFTTAEEAATFLALVKRDNLLERFADENGLPPKQDKPHKPRSSSGALPRAAHCTLSTAHAAHCVVREHMSTTIPFAVSSMPMPSPELLP